MHARMCDGLGKASRCWWHGPGTPSRARPSLGTTAKARCRPSNGRTSTRASAAARPRIPHAARRRARTRRPRHTWTALERHQRRLTPRLQRRCRGLWRLSRGLDHAQRFFPPTAAPTALGRRSSSRWLVLTGSLAAFAASIFTPLLTSDSRSSRSARSCPCSSGSRSACASVAGAMVGARGGSSVAPPAAAACVHR